MHLQNILFPDNEFCNIPEMYYHISQDGQWIDLDGYFNLFYIEKRKVYTNLQSLAVEIRLRGYSRLRLMHDRDEIKRVDLLAEETKDYHIEFPYSKFDKGLFWISLQKNGESDSCFAEGCFTGESSQLSEINIALDICTFHRENYVIGNMKTLLYKVFQSGEEAGKHLSVFIIDNGNTLPGLDEIRDLTTATNGKIQVFPNKNAGGTGGFTRGILEALKRESKEKISHVLLMDDDAVFHWDLFTRLYALLAMLRDEYRGISIGGALLREDFPYLQYASGESYKDFRIVNRHMLDDMREYKNASAEYMTSPKSEEGTYSGWWCCCYSLKTVRQAGLPMPLFIHYDDMTYGRSVGEAGIVFLNGICVWHRGFELTFTGVNKYYDMRNGLINTAVFDPRVRLRDIGRWSIQQVLSMLLSFRYAEAELACLGLRDFMKGPDWLSGTDPEKLHSSLMALYRKGMPMKPYSEWELPDSLEKEIEDYTAGYGLKEIRERYLCSEFSGLLNKWKLYTLNGCFLPSKKGIIPISATESRLKAYRRKKAFLYEPFNRRGAIAKKNWGAILRIVGMILKMEIVLLCRFKSISKEYRKGYQKLGSIDMWEKYLGLK